MADGNGTKIELTFFDIITGAYATSTLTVNDRLSPDATLLPGGGNG